jgi:hypothetical protein
MFTVEAAVDSLDLTIGTWDASSEDWNVHRRAVNLLNHARTEVAS